MSRFQSFGRVVVIPSLAALAAGYIYLKAADASLMASFTLPLSDRPMPRSIAKSAEPVDKRTSPPSYGPGVIQELVVQEDYSNVQGDWSHEFMLDLFDDVESGDGDDDTDPPTTETEPSDAGFFPSDFELFDRDSEVRSPGEKSPPIRDRKRDIEALSLDEIWESYATSMNLSIEEVQAWAEGAEPGP